MLLSAPQRAVEAQSPARGSANSVAVVSDQFPGPESLYYTIEWRLWYAGTARVTLRPQANQEWQSAVHLESAGLVSKLFTVNDNYTADLRGNGFCTDDTRLDALEGKRHKLTTVEYDYKRDKATYSERDLHKNAVVRTAETDIPACASDVIGALLKLRTMRVDPGQSATIPVSDGKKFVNLRVEAQQREDIQTKLGKFKAIRYEANIFNGVLYNKQARMFLWLTDDNRRLPIQIRVRMQLVIGTITLSLDRVERGGGPSVQAASVAGVAAKPPRRLVN